MSCSVKSLPQDRLDTVFNGLGINCLMALLHSVKRVEKRTVNGELIWIVKRLLWPA
jgi:hypothetical protein